MLKIIFLLTYFSSAIFANETHYIDLTKSWIGIIVLIIFIIGYYFIANEEKYKLDKAISALFIGLFSFLLIGLYYHINGLNITLVHHEIEVLIFEISGIIFFLFVAMTYIESLIYMGAFDKLKYTLISKNYSYKKIFWITGFLAFFLSPIADNLTTALILSTVLITIEKNNKDFLVPGAINIVVAANAGGAWSPFGDITTLMVWTAQKSSFVDFLYLFPSSILGYLATAFLLSNFIPKDKPKLIENEDEPKIKKGAKTIAFLGLLTIIISILCHQILGFPAMWGMMFGLVLLGLYSYKLNKTFPTGYFKVTKAMSKIEYSTLLFFFGILSAVGALYFIGWLNLAAIIYQDNYLGSTYSNIFVGFLSAIIDNVPIMSAILKANPDMDLANWLLVTLTAGIGGSLISFGSAAGVGVMGKLKGIYTFITHMKYAWTILVGYFISILIWYLQFIVFKV